MKTTVEPKRMKVAINAQKSLLINIVGVFRGAQKVHRQSEHTLVIGADELLEGGVIPLLSGPDQRRLVQHDARLQGQGGGSNLPVQHLLGRLPRRNVTESKPTRGRSSSGRGRVRRF